MRKYNFPSKKSVVYRVGIGQETENDIMWIVEPLVIKKSLVRKEGLRSKGKQGLNLA